MNEEMNVQQGYRVLNSNEEANKGRRWGGWMQTHGQGWPCVRL